MLSSRIRLLIGLFVGIVGIAVWVSAQTFHQEPLSEPIVVTGADIGYRIEGRVGDSVYGQFVVRMNGRWVSVRPEVGTRQLAE